MIGKLKKNIVTYLSKKRLIEESIFNYLGAEYIGEIEDYFTTTSGFELPIFNYYRYSMKKGYRSFWQLALMDQLKHRELLTNDGKKILNESIGHRTLQEDISRADRFVSEFVNRNGEYFIKDSLDKQPVLKFSLQQINNSVKNNIAKQSTLFEKLGDLNLFDIAPNKRLLEIGYSSGGYSLFAFEQLGLEVYGIDNCYGGIVEPFYLHDYIAKKMMSTVNFEEGDICKKTIFEDDFFDIIYSKSVLEHIQDIQAAFQEMYRILKPGGIIVHGYHPYFCPNGGHAIGIPDCPWGHVRMSYQNYREYISKFRPYEASTAIEWLNNALNPELSISKMQREVVWSGFSIKSWTTRNANVEYLRYLTNDIMKQCFETHEHITIEDLITQNVTFVAQKIS
ncbi:class I SAM-dependent methyltransferase [Desulforhopalus sp. 52FAK]